MGKFDLVDVSRKLQIKDYERFGKGTEHRLRGLARPLRGARIIHVNTTSVGGGVAELLQSQVPFERALGIKSRWYAIRAPHQFFSATKQLHDLLQGKHGKLGEKEKNTYLEVNRGLGKLFAGIVRSFRPDLVVIHDPQPLPLIAALNGKVPIISRLHLDLLTPNPLTLEFIRPFITNADRVILSSREYAANLPWVPKSRKVVIFPAIDPLAEKNRDISPDTARGILRTFGVNMAKPVISQVSRFDPWKDPMGVVRAYYLAKNKIPNLELVLAGLFLANDDPEAVGVFERVKKHAKGDPEIFLFADPRAIRDVSADLFVSAIYAASTVIMQKSIREGFGLTMTEAMWKGKAIVAGDTSGARAQVRNGKTGIIVSSPEEAARAIVRLLKDETLRARIGRAARESVRRHFLMPRFVADNLKAYLVALAVRIPHT